MGPNNIPEVAVVLSDMFMGFVGFRPVGEIQQFLRNVPELREAIGQQNAEYVYFSFGSRETIKGDVWRNL